MKNNRFKKIIRLVVFIASWGITLLLCLLIPYLVVNVSWKFIFLVFIVPYPIVWLSMLGRSDYVHTGHILPPD